MPKEEYARVLDFLPQGHPLDRRRLPLAQLIGEDYFTLLEVVPRDNTTLEPGERVYIGEGKREKISFIKDKIDMDRLTGSSKMELESIIKDIVKSKEKEMVEFFNEIGPITTRYHGLELLPGVGKKHMWKIIEKREEEPFKSFEDLKKRVSLLPDPVNMLTKKILEELKEETKYNLFVSK